MQNKRAIWRSFSVLSNDFCAVLKTLEMHPTQVCAFCCLMFGFACVTSGCSWPGSGRCEFTESKQYVRDKCGLLVVPTDIPSDAKEVILCNNKITQLLPNAFRNLTKCTLLKLKYNPIALIMPGAFNGLVSLHLLDMWYLDLSTKSLAPGSFMGLTNLKTLQIVGSYIGSLSKGAFSGMNSAVEVYIYYDALTTLRADTFNFLSLCKKLHLANNKLSNIHLGAFRGLHNLEHLVLKSNSLKKLSGFMFYFLPELLYLRLSGNQITVVHTKAFHGLLLLLVLDLENNRISAIPRGAFALLTRMTFLCLANNNIKTLEPGSLDGQVNLWELRLWNNELTTLEQSLFRNVSTNPDQSEPLRIGLSHPHETDRNLWDCQSLCWLKSYQKRTNFEWFEQIYEPRCAGGVRWDSINCSESGRLIELVCFPSPTAAFVQVIKPNSFCLLCVITATTTGWQELTFEETTSTEPSMAPSYGLLTLFENLILFCFHRKLKLRHVLVFTTLTLTLTLTHTDTHTHTHTHTRTHTHTHT